MKRLFRLVVASMFLIRCGAFGQGTFQNLDFEQANVPIIPSGQFGADVAPSNGIPGWTAYIGGLQPISIRHNNESLGAASISILGPQWFPPQILEGNYTVLLQGSSAGPTTTAAIGQTGQLPQNAASVRFFGNGGYTVTFAGQQIPLVVLGNTATYTIFGGDISGFNNQVGELRFQGGGLLDNIFFSNQPIPEPSIFCFFGLGALLLGWRFLCRRP